LAASGDDEGTKLVDLTSAKVFRTLKSSPYTRALSIDPEGQFLAATTADGTLSVWNIVSGKAELAAKRACPRCESTPTLRSRPSWHPDGGALLVAPGPDGSIVAFERLSWEKTAELDGAHSGPVAAVSFSPNGLYLASAGSDQALVIWDFNERKVLAKRVLPGVATGLAWHPSANALTVITEDGELGVWDGPVPKGLPGPAVDVDALAGVKRKGEDEAGGAGDGGGKGARGMLGEWHWLAGLFTYALIS
jgi:chromosome transmission fidelity protein 4